LALESAADEICIVPENRQEITTEGGLDAIAEGSRLSEAIPRFQERGMLVSLFVDPEPDQLEAAAASGAEFIELHTGSFANANGEAVEEELERLHVGAQRAHELGLRVNAGHGLDYDNVHAVLDLPHLEELNIGHSIVSRAVFDGVEQAVRDMLACMGRSSL
jgi:pyridoxine 5-phosphate synthase